MTPEPGSGPEGRGPFARTRQAAPAAATRLLHSLGLALPLATVCAAQCFGQAIDTNLWVANGIVWAVARTESTIYIGGRFTQVGPATGGGAPLDGSSGTPQASFPKVVGAVL